MPDLSPGFLRAEAAYLEPPCQCDDDECPECNRRKARREREECEAMNDRSEP